MLGTWDGFWNLSDWTGGSSTFSVELDTAAAAVSAMSRAISARRAVAVSAVASTTKRFAHTFVASVGHVASQIGQFFAYTGTALLVAIRPGSVPTFALPVTFVNANVSGNYYPNSGRSCLIAKNDSGGTISIFVQGNRCEFGGVHGLQVDIPAGATELLGPYGKERFNDANGYVNLTYSSTTNLTLALVSSV